MTKKQGPGRTFSDKMEQDGGYEPEEEPHHRRVQAVFSEKTGLFSYTQEGISDEEIHTGDDPLDSITGDSINKFVNEYEKSKSKPIPTSKENTGRIDNMIDRLPVLWAEMPILWAEWKSSSRSAFQKRRISRP